MEPFENHKLAGLFIALFRWFCDPESVEDIEGDLTEGFQRNLSRFGVGKANWLLMREVVLLFRPALLPSPFENLQFNSNHMKNSEWLRVPVIHALLVVLMVSPFLPGPPNKLVIGLSALAQSMAFLGVLLVPLGVLWLILDFRTKGSQASRGKHGYVLASISAVIVAIPCVLALVYAFMLIGPGAGAALSAILAALFYRGFIKIKKLKTGATHSFNSAPVYLLTIPALSLFMRIYVMGPVSMHSRELAIARSESLIALVENYKSEQGRYPVSLQELSASTAGKLPGSPVMGIRELKYSLDDDGFNVSFSQWQNMAIDEEIVLFDRAGNTQASFADYDYRLDKFRVKGAYASYDTHRNNWRYYLCD